MSDVEKLALTVQVVELRKIQLEINNVIDRRIEALEAKLKQMEKDNV